MDDGSATYLHVTIQLARGKNAVFVSAMSEMVPALEEYGWRLVVAVTPVVGRLNAVFHVWRVPSADGVLTALSRVRSHPDVKRWHAAYAESILDETVQMVVPLTYSPQP